MNIYEQILIVPAVVLGFCLALVALCVTLAFWASPLAVWAWAFDRLEHRGWMPFTAVPVSAIPAGWAAVLVWHVTVFVGGLL